MDRGNEQIMLENKNSKIERRFDELLSKMNNYIKLSDEYADFNENSHEQIADIHHQGRVAREKLNNVQGYMNKFATKRKNNQVRSNALAYIKTVEDAVIPPPHSYYSMYMSSNTGEKLKWI